MGGRERIPFTLGSPLPWNPFSIGRQRAPGAFLPPLRSVETPLCVGKKRGSPLTWPPPLCGHPPAGPPSPPSPGGQLPAGWPARPGGSRWAGSGGGSAGPGWATLLWLYLGEKQAGLRRGHPNSAHPGRDHPPPGVLRWGQCPGRGSGRGSDSGQPQWEQCGDHSPSPRWGLLLLPRQERGWDR